MICSIFRTFGNAALLPFRHLPWRAEFTPASRYPAAASIHFLCGFGLSLNADQS
jgi:hypothetical protein